MSVASDRTERFSDRVDDYVNSRPTYPLETVNALDEHFNLPQKCIVADIGSGTGISSKVFIDGLSTKEPQILGVEPNKPMREAAEVFLKEQIGTGQFKSINATAEKTGLEDSSVDIVVAGQAFHWFDFEAAKKEFARILCPPKRVALVWNQWSSRHGGMTVGKTYQGSDTRFMQAYEALIEKYSPEYKQVNHTSRVNEEVLKTFFGGSFEAKEFANPYRLTWEQLKGRALSSSYSPKQGQEGHDGLVADLRANFDRFQEGGTVEFTYTTRLFFGNLR